MTKRSVVELDVPVDASALAAEVGALPAAAWSSSYWGSPHCSVAVVLLRGGREGTQDDFLCDEVVDQPALARLPRVRALIGPDGPFGGCRYAFLFRMAPDGVALAHTDGAPVWSTLHRVHVPITTHPDAVLVVEGRVWHLAPGRAWTFDNQRLHGFVNGPTERVHLILDVPPSPAMLALLAEGVVHAGAIDPARASRTLDRSRAVPSWPGDAAVRGWIAEAAAAGWSDDDLLAWLVAHGVPTREHGGAWTLEALRALRDPPQEAPG